jgi:hypothetical protein
MPWNVRRESQFFDKEVLKVPAGLDAIKSIVLDANAFAQNADVNKRTVVPAGTVLKFSATISDRYVAYDGSGTVRGVLARPVDLLVQATSGNEPAPMFFHQCVFATSQLVGFTQYASAVVSTLDTCKFE